MDRQIYQLDGPVTPADLTQVIAIQEANGAHEAAKITLAELFALFAKDGVYTPTPVAYANCSDFIVTPLTYLQVGKSVTVSGKIGGTYVPNSGCQFMLDLPFPGGQFTNTGQCGGTGKDGNNPHVTAHIGADISNNKVVFTFNSEIGNSFLFYFEFTARIQ